MTNKKTKILFILHLPPPVHGSSVVGKQIFDSKKINNKFDCVFINLSTSSQVNKIGKLSLGKLTKYFSILFKIFSILLFKKIDKVYLAPTVSKGGFLKDYWVYFILFLFKKKRVFHLHNKGVSKRKESKIINYLYRTFFKNAKVILLSQNLYEDISEFVDEKDVVICPNGIKDEIDDLNIRFNKVNKHLNLLFLSNLIESKGVYVLLKACEILKQKNIDFTCNFIGGEGNISKEIFNQKVIESNLENNVYYLGKKYDDEKKEYFLKSDIFILPTLNETFGLVNVEAMMYGLPVISTDEGGITDIIVDNETGYIVNKNNSIDLAKKIEFLANNQDVINLMGANGRFRFKEKFSLEVFEKRMLDILSY